jgi:predicted Zn-ribbon and HTH transcriptional regulator
MSFDFLDELAAFYGYITDKQYLKCKTCGFLVDKQKATQMVECPKCGENEWEETSLLEA